MIARIVAINDSYTNSYNDTRPQARRGSPSSTTSTGPAPRYTITIVYIYIHIITYHIIYIYIYICMYMCNIYIYIYIHVYIICYILYIIYYILHAMYHMSQIHTEATLLSCAIYTHTPARKSSTNFQLYYFAIQICSTNWLGHGHGYKWHSSVQNLSSQY